MNLNSMLAQIKSRIAPMWPLDDFVAVNPFVGLADRRFLEARRALRRIRSLEMLPTWEYFEEQFRQGAVRAEDLHSALLECRREYPESFSRITVEDLFRALRRSPERREDEMDDRGVWTIAELIDVRHGTQWEAELAAEVSKCCAAHFDEGQAVWRSPWRELTLYSAWREMAQIDRRMEHQGISGFRRLVAELPISPQAAVTWLLESLRLPAEYVEDFLACELASVGGWGAYLKSRLYGAQAVPTDQGAANDDLTGLLAIRLAYDVGLFRAFWPAQGPPVADFLKEESLHHPLPMDTLARYAWQVATEVSYRRGLLPGLCAAASPPASDDSRKLAQLVFCIDVRSELMRRNLESVSSRLETWGFAGFFGVAMEYVPLGASSGSAQCPVLLRPAVKFQETVRSGAESTGPSAVLKRETRRLFRGIWNGFQRSAVSCFSFVEGAGLPYFGKLLSGSSARSSASRSSRFDGIRPSDRAGLGPELVIANQAECDRWTDLAQGILKNLGLMSGFARLVVLCGHESATVNNPYQAGLDCGACGGHSGESNARAACLILNAAPVRQALAARDIEVPEDVWFLPAVHNTTTDEMEFFDLDLLPATHAADLEELRELTRKGSALTRAERAGRLEVDDPRGVLRRSRDWSEVRPEWGLAGNAALIAAPRWRTAGLCLEGRTFLHNYDAAQDPEGKVLELIMTAPMIVANWINLQYYASTVDNRHLGSGNKTLHNVVGRLGILEGNRGDLRVGLPWQSVHDGMRLQHQPLRLLVCLEASRQAIEAVVDRHLMVRNLATNGWLQLVSLEEDRAYRYEADGTWQEQQYSAAEESSRQERASPAMAVAGV
ncbi:MAG: YbcC family protein [Planctomycetales bacterium]